MRIVKPVLMVIGMVVAIASSSPLLAEQLVRFPVGSAEGDFRFIYPVRVLQLALDKTAQEYGAARAVQVQIPMTTARITAELSKGGTLDVASFPASKELEQRLTPVPICIHKGILGIRLFLIDARRQGEFSAIQNLEELKKLSAGQGSDWLDTRVLRSNGFEVVTGPNYEGLFGMLLAKRFDFFPRGAYEPFVEVQQRAERMPQLAVEKSLALYYPYPDFLWVKKGNTALAERLRKGLEAAIADGSFESLFESEYGDAIRQAKLEQRRIFRLSNPEYDKMPHAGDPRYWLVSPKNQTVKILR